MTRGREGGRERCRLTRSHQTRGFLGQYVNFDRILRVQFAKGIRIGSQKKQKTKNKKTLLYPSACNPPPHTRIRVWAVPLPLCPSDFVTSMDVNPPPRRSTLAFLAKFLVSYLVDRAVGIVSLQTCRAGTSCRGIGRNALKTLPHPDNHTSSFTITNPQ